MKTIPIFILFFLLIINILSAQNAEFIPLKMEYKQAAQNFSEALPIGNGKMGAMIYGAWETETIVLNDNTLWSGSLREWNNSNSALLFPIIKQEAMENDFAEAEIIWKKMEGPYPECYLPLANLMLDFIHPFGAVSNYKRELDIDSALCKIEYSIGNVQFRRQIFASYPSKTIILHFEASQKSHISLDVSLRSKLHYTTEAIDANEFILKGKAPSHVAQSESETTQVVYDQNSGMSFEVRIKAIATNGSVSTDNAHLFVRKADALTLIISSATSFNGYNRNPATDGKNPSAETTHTIRMATEKSFDELKAEHIADYQLLYKRFQLKLGESNLPSVLTAQYGRYLLISASRNGNQAATLQGLWNNEVNAYRGSNYKLNINTPMTYWAAENSNLAECQQPLFDLVDVLMKNGQTTAKVNYAANGWVSHCYTDIWGQTAPAGQFELEIENVNQQTAWLMGGAWLSLHLWNAYLHQADKQFLQSKAYPAMKGAAEFALNLLVEDQNKQLVLVPSVSPENRFKYLNDKNLAVSMASTMDMALVYQLFSSCIEASQILGADAAFRTRMSQALRKLPPVAVGSNGAIPQWFNELEAEDMQSPYIPHIFGLYPANQISVQYTPQLASAAQLALEMSGNGTTQWSKVWRAAAYTRLYNGNKALELIDNQLFSIDISANAGATAAIVEMLVQSHNGEIHLLPALPQKWQNGSVKGLKAVGGFEIDITWENGKLKQAEVRSLWGGECRIRTSEKILIDGNLPKLASGKCPNPLLFIPPTLAVKSSFKGKYNAIKISGENVFDFSTRKNGVYKITVN